MNSQTAKDITGFRSYLPDALRLRFDEQLSVRAIALQLGLSHSTIHNLFQRFNASVLLGHYLNHFQSPNSMPYFMPIERRNYLMILKSAKAHGEKNDEPPTVVNLKSGW